MKACHTARIDLRYWIAIVLASVFGTNMGDFYAHNSGLGIGPGVGLLALLTLGVFLAERLERRTHELYYWLVIVIIRTGATNIADWLAYRVRIPGLELCLGLAALMGLFAWWSVQRARPVPGQPQSDAAYWVAMLGAGVFGTVLGDIFEHSIGKGIAAIACSVVYAAVLGLVGARAARLVALYWITVAVARTAGTAIGDWLAENHVLDIGLPLSTLLSGLVLANVILFWKGGGRAGPAALRV